MLQLLLYVTNNWYFGKNPHEQNYVYMKYCQLNSKARKLREFSDISQEPFVLYADYNQTQFKLFLIYHRSQFWNSTIFIFRTAA